MSFHLLLFTHHEVLGHLVARTFKTFDLRDLERNKTVTVVSRMFVRMQYNLSPHASIKTHLFINIV